MDYESYDDSRPSNEYHKFMQDTWKEVYRVLKVGGRLCLNVPATTAKPIRENFLQNTCNDVDLAGFEYRNTIIWDKQNMSKRTAWGSFAMPSNPWAIPPFESILVYHKESPKMIGERSDIDITKEEFIAWSNALWKFAPENRVPEHPAVFPKELPKRCMKFWSYMNCTVLDPFLGAGTTAMVANEHNRNCIGIEIDEKYVDLSIKRVFGDKKYATEDLGYAKTHTL